MLKIEQETKKSFALILISLIVGLSLICSTSLVTKALVTIKDTNTVTVTGSAKKEIKSDLVVWRGNFSASSQTMAAAYNKLKADLVKVKAYLKGKGIKTSDIIVSSIQSSTIFEQNSEGNNTNTVIGYSLYQTVEISSSDVDGITKISRESTELINNDVAFESQAPEYFYTKIADLKVRMLAEATKDAKTRGIQIAENTGSKLGALKSARMGVFQITALYSNDAEDYGVNDTSSLYKEITAVISCSFQVK